MTLASDIITNAYREVNIIPLGTTPNAAQQAEGLTKLNAYIGSVYGEELGERLKDWIAPAPQRTAPVAANYPQLPYPTDLLGVSPLALSPAASAYQFPPTNSRIVFGGVALTVYFPEQPEDGARMELVQGSGAGDNRVNGSTLVLDGNGRTIEGANTQSYVTPVTQRRWLYRSDLGNWQAIATLLIGDTFPFPTDLDLFWTAALAVRLAPSYGKVIPDATAQAFKSGLANIKSRYRQRAVTTYGASDFPSSYQSFRPGRTWG